jgi:uncharacterized DUF497 family protein
LTYNRSLEVEWDPLKNEENEHKHGVSFREAAGLFSSGRDYLEIFDTAHSEREDRLIAIGSVRRGVIVVIWTERDDNTVRIISARWATQREQLMYRKYLESSHDR